MNPMVFGGTALQSLVQSNSIIWGKGVIFMTELAHVSDADKLYWIVRKNDRSFNTITCDKRYGCLGWGTIRRDENGKMRICQVLPKHIEQALRRLTVITLKKEAVSKLPSNSE